MALNNLAWILATSKEPTLSNPKDALMFAERLCEKTKHSAEAISWTNEIHVVGCGQFFRDATFCGINACTKCSATVITSIKTVIQNAIAQS